MKPTIYIPPPPTHTHTQAIFDIIYHLVDLIFALDCNAPPLFILLTDFGDAIYSMVSRAGRPPCI